MNSTAALASARSAVQLAQLHGLTVTLTPEGDVTVRGVARRTGRERAERKKSQQISDADLRKITQKVVAELQSVSFEALVQVLQHESRVGDGPGSPRFHR